MSPPHLRRSLVKIRIYHVGTLVSLWALMGCVHKPLLKNLREHTYGLQQQQKQLGSSVSENQKQLSWAPAWNRLLSSNQQYQQALVSLQETEKERKQFYWRQLGPRLNAVANVSAALDELASLSSNAASFQLFGSLNIPSPIALYAQRYALELEYYSSLLQIESSRRRLAEQLYRLFLEQAELELTQEETSRTLAQDRENLIKQLSSHDQEKTITRANRRRQIQLQLRINRLLNTSGERFILNYESLPKLDYHSRLETLQFNSGFGYLALQQIALRLEVSRSRIRQINISRLPSFNFNTSLPTLFDSSRETSPSFDDVRLFSGANRSITFDGRRERSKRSAEFRYKSLQEQIKLQLEQEKSSLEFLKEEYTSLFERRKRLQTELSFLKTKKRARPHEFVDHLKKIEQTQQGLYQNQIAIRRLDVRFWVWDEQFWAETRIPLAL